MSHFLVIHPASRLRLVPQTLMPGESISSLVDRQAQLWGVSRKQLAYQAASISGLRAKRDMDCCRDDDFLDMYAEKTGIDRQTLKTHRAQRSYPLMFPRLRYAYCPMCFEEDASAGYTPYFRLDWARIFLTHCRLHSCPLFRWPHVLPDGTRKLPHGWFLGEGQDQRTLPQFRKDLILATKYARGVRPKKSSSVDAWNTLTRFEAWLYRLGIGAPEFVGHDEPRWSIESDIVKQISMMARSTTVNGRLLIGESKAISFEEQRVMSFAFKAVKIYKRDLICRYLSADWRDLRCGLQSMACRRAVLFMGARSFGCAENLGGGIKRFAKLAQ